MSRGAAKEGAGRSIALRTIRRTSLSEHSSFAAPPLIRGVCPQPQGWRPGLNSQRRSAAPERLRRSRRRPVTRKGQTPDPLPEGEGHSARALLPFGEKACPERLRAERGGVEGVARSAG